MQYFKVPSQMDGKRVFRQLEDGSFERTFTPVRELVRDELYTERELCVSRFPDRKFAGFLERVLQFEVAIQNTQKEGLCLTLFLFFDFPIFLFSYFPQYSSYLNGYS